jgi:C4-dicarboxylate-specific signal transduction histidine kinase
VKLPRYWPLLVIAAAVVLVARIAQYWLSSKFELVDANDAEFLNAANAALIWTVSAVLLVVVIAYLLLDHQRQQIERQLEQAKAALRVQLEQEAEARRLGLLGALAAGLAHELGQPLSAARVGIEGLHYLRQLGREPSPEHVEKTFSRVGMSLLAMTQTIEHLRGLATGAERGPLSDIDLVSSVTTLLVDRQQWLRFNDARIAWEPPAQPIMARGDAAGLRMILTNLVRNAVEAVSGQGEGRRLVRIVVGPGPSVAVHDSGPGIAAELQARLFDPYVSTKGGDARGVGLSLARASAQRMGAELRVASQPGSGSTFTLHLLPPQPAGAAAPGAPA